MFALLSVWIALGAFATTIATVATTWSGKETAVTILPYTYALSLTFAAGVLWACRHRQAHEPGVAGQRLQAVAAILINAVAITVLLIAANGIVYGLAGLAVEIGFLWFCYWAYRRVVLRQ